MKRLTLFLLCLPLAILGQTPNNSDYSFTRLGGTFGGDLITPVFPGFISIQRGDTCQDSIATFYSQLNYVVSGLSDTVSGFSCDSTQLSATTSVGLGNVSASHYAGLRGFITEVDSNNQFSSAYGSLKTEWDFASHKVIIKEVDLHLSSGNASDVTAALSIVVWKADENRDSAFSEADIIWESTARLLQHELAVTGLLTTADFFLQNYSDSAVADAQDLTFVVNIPANIEMCDVVVQMDGRIYQVVQQETPSVLGISGSRENKMRVYPNPVQNEINIALHTPTPGAVGLFDSQGRLVTTYSLSQYTNTALNVAHLSAGVYHLCLQAGNEWHYQTVIIIPANK